MSGKWGYRLSTGYGRGWSQIFSAEPYTTEKDVTAYAMRVAEARGIAGPCVKITRNGRTVRTVTVEVRP